MSAIANWGARLGRVAGSVVRADGRQIRRYFKQVGLPQGAAYYVVKLLKGLMHPAAWLERRLARARIRRSPTLDGLLDRKKGFARVPSEALPDLPALVESVRAEFEQRRDSLPEDDDYRRVVIQPEEIGRYPEVMRVVLSDAVLQIASDYLGAVPVLQSVQAWWSPADAASMGGGLKGSQLYHRDQLDLRQVKFMVNVSDVGSESGPFTFLPADVSARVSKRLRDWRSRSSDEEVYRYCSPQDAIETSGPSGTVHVLDSCRCLHYGGRARSGERLVLMFNFASYFSGLQHRLPIRLDPQRYAQDRLRRLVVNAP